MWRTARGGGDIIMSLFSFFMSLTIYGLAVYTYVLVEDFNKAVIYFLVGLQVSIWGIANKINK